VLFKRRSGLPQQQSDLLDEHSHIGSVPKIALLISALAHPVPASTEIAPARQFLAQAPHSMQASRSTIFALRFSKAKTP
jgi:hypothetical protein